jgi:hypothetical protein
LRFGRDRFESALCGGRAGRDVGGHQGTKLVVASKPTFHFGPASWMPETSATGMQETSEASSTGGRRRFMSG